MSVVIGPPATHLLFENADVKVWLMDVAPGETYPHHYHDHDYVLFYTTDVLATVHDDAPSSFPAPAFSRRVSSTSDRHRWWRR